MRHLDLFSGIGGFALAAKWVGWETVEFCEIDDYCQRVLKKNFPDVPINGDIKTYEGQECDIITGGFPCQPYSQAGKQRGSEDDRDLWPEFIRLIEKLRPTWVVGENVAGFIRVGLDQAVTDLEKAYYSWAPFVLPACAVNAPHRRDRVFLVAHSEWNKQPREKSRSREVGRVGREFKPVSWDRNWEDAVTHARRVDDGLSGRVVTNRTDAIRNAIVPQIAYEIFKAIDIIDNGEFDEQRND